MRKIVLCMVAAIATLTMFAQTSEHLTFKGIPIDGSLSEYVGKLKKAGFTYLGEQDGTAILKGEFAGFKDCTLGVVKSQNSNNVSLVGVIFPELDTWGKLESNYSSLKNMLTTKYGEPSFCVEKFEGYTEPRDDNSRMHELKMDRCKYACIFETDKGDIELSIAHESVMSCYVMLRYLDKINTNSVRQQAMDDL